MKGGGRVLAPLPSPDLARAEGEPRHIAQHRPGLGFAREPVLLPRDRVELGLEALTRLLQVGRDRPVLLRLECEDLVLPLADEAKGHRLDATGGEPGQDRLPEEGRDLVSDEPIEDPSRLLGLELPHVEGARRSDGLRDRLAGDLSELDAPEAVRILPEPEVRRHVVGDRLALPIGVGREDHRIDPLRPALEFGQNLRFPVDRDVAGLEALVHVHAELLLRKVPDVAHRSGHLESAAQVATDGPRLGRRLYNDEATLAIPVPVRH